MVIQGRLQQNIVFVIEGRFASEQLVELLQYRLVGTVIVRQRIHLRGQSDETL
jgi:hypothetical protein